MRLPAVFLVLLAGPAMAQDWALRDGDVLFTDPQLSARLAGNTLVFYDGGRSVFAMDGRYSYTYGGGGTAFGSYEFAEDSTVCIRFANGAARCDRYVLNNTRLVVLTEDGQRFPVRPDN